jgi:hypothetical protein
VKTITKGVEELRGRIEGAILDARQALYVNEPARRALCPYISRIKIGKRRA